MKLSEYLKDAWEKIKTPFLIIGGAIVALVCFLLFIKQPKTVFLKQEIDVPKLNQEVDKKTEELKNKILNDGKITQQEIQNKTPEQVLNDLKPSTQKDIENIKNTAVNNIMGDIDKLLKGSD